jgi:hypothetical protein
MVKVLVRAGLCGPGLTASTLLRRLRNPALMGYRVEEDKNGGVRRSKILLGNDAKPIRVADVSRFAAVTVCSPRGPEATTAWL